MANKSLKEIISSVTVNYDGKALKPNEVLVLSHQEALFIRTNVTSAENIVNVPIPNTCKSVKAVLIAVDRDSEEIAKAQFNSWLNDYLGHFASKMTAESIEDRQERELPERGQSCSAEDTVISKQNFEDSIRILIQDDPQSAYAALLKATGYTGAEFEEKMQLKHNAANKAMNKMESLLKALLAGEEVEIKANNTKRTEGYRREAEKILEELIKLL